MAQRPDSGDEPLDIVDESGAVIGATSRRAVHGDPTLLHPVVHCAVVDAAGDLLLQLRARTKKVQPGRWDMAVGGHVARGESIDEALAREMAEEIGVKVNRAHPRFLYRYVWHTDFESELVHTFGCVWDGPIRRQVEEIDALRYWPRAEIVAHLGGGLFTPNLEEETRRLGRAGFWG